MVPGIGGFGGQFPLDIARFRAPVLVASTDGVGTKMVVARDTGRYETVGIDLVAMCVDDLVCVGAEPLFMLDYIATGKVDPDQVATVVAGRARGLPPGGLRADRRGDGRARRRHGARRARPGRLRRRRRGAGDPARPRAGARRRRRRRAALARAALQRLHAGPPRPARAGRPRAGRPRLGGGRAQRGRRAAAAVGDLHPGRAGAARRPGRRRCTPAPTSPAAASWATCPGRCPPAWARCSTARPGPSRGCSPRSSGWARWPRTRWTGSSTAASAWRWWSTPARSARPLRALEQAGQPASVIGEVVAGGAGVRFR